MIGEMAEEEALKYDDSWFCDYCDKAQFDSHGGVIWKDFCFCSEECKEKYQAQL